jgi:hypothetical protein
MNLETLYRIIDTLSAEEKQQIVAYIQGQIEREPAPKQSRVFNLHAGLIWMSDDFDAELPDSFWLG